MKFNWMTKEEDKLMTKIIMDGNCEVAQAYRLGRKSMELELLDSLGEDGKVFLEKAREKVIWLQ